jgi:hypothetical protein
MRERILRCDDDVRRGETTGARRRRGDVRTKERRKQSRIRVTACSHWSAWSDRSIKRASEGGAEQRAADPSTSASERE